MSNLKDVFPGLLPAPEDPPSITGGLYGGLRGREVPGMKGCNKRTFALLSAGSAGALLMAPLKPMDPGRGVEGEEAPHTVGTGKTNSGEGGKKTSEGMPKPKETSERTLAEASLMSLRTISPLNAHGIKVHKSLSLNHGKILDHKLGKQKEDGTEHDSVLRHPFQQHSKEMPEFVQRTYSTQHGIKVHKWLSQDQGVPRLTQFFKSLSLAQKRRFISCCTIGGASSLAAVTLTCLVFSSVTGWPLETRFVLGILDVFFTGTAMLSVADVVILIKNHIQDLDAIPTPLNHIQNLDIRNAIPTPLNHIQDASQAHPKALTVSSV